MHRMNCNCPQCRAASEGFGFETFGPGEAAGVLSEQAGAGAGDGAAQCPD